VLQGTPQLRKHPVYKTECLFVYFVCKSTVLLRSWWNFVHLIFKTRRNLLSTLILQKPTPTTILNPVKKKRRFFRVGNTLTFAASPLFHPLSISPLSPLDTHKKQPLLSFLSLLSTKKVFSSWKWRLHDMFRCHSYIWLFIKVAISQNVFEWLCFTGRCLKSSRTSFK
jgi:hypothetical protein